MNPERDDQEKARILSAYLREQGRVARALRIPERHARQGAVHRLRAQLPGGNGSEKAALQRVLDRITGRCKNGRAAPSSRQMILQILLALEPGTAIIVRLEGREHLAVFLSACPGRFRCELPDGRQYTLALQFFVRIAEEQKIERLPDEIRQRRLLVRRLSSRRSDEVAEQIIGYGEPMLDPLLDELAAATERLREKQKEIVAGLLIAPPVSGAPLVTEDQLLVRGIPPVVARLADRLGADYVRDRVAKHPSEAVRRLLGKLNCMVEAGSVV
jgi:hypothetical protein